MRCGYTGEMMIKTVFMALLLAGSAANAAFAGWFTNDLTDAAAVAADFDEYISSAGNSAWSYTNDYALAQDGTTNSYLQGGAVLDWVTADDNTARSYLATVESDWLESSWTAHIAIEAPSDTYPYIYFGLGDPTPDEDYSNEPQHGQSIYVSWCSGVPGSKVTVTRNGETVHNTGSWQGDPGYDLYMTYNHLTQTVEFEIDNWNGGRFSGVNVTTDPISVDGFLTETNTMHLFFGANAKVTFRDFYVEEVFQCIHPGLPFTVEDLDAVKAKLDTEPWKTGYEELAGSSYSSLDYTMRGPCDVVGRTSNTNLSEFKNDMQAIYNLSRMWYYTEEAAYAQKAHDILISWATNHTAFTGGEIYLSMGDYTYRVFGGADILRGTWDGWTDEDTEICKTYFENLYWDEDIIAVPNPLRSANQGILQLISGVGVAIFNDDEEKFNMCLESFRSDAAGGLLSSLPNGQIGDTGRDFHDYGQLQHLTWIAEAFWKQGVDVFAEHDNRLLAAGEYFARYNLGYDTPFIQAGTVYDVYPEINYLGDSGQAYGGSPDALNIIHGAYVVRKGMTAPYLETYRDILGEDSESFDRRKTADASTAEAPEPLAAAAPAASVTSLFNADIGDASPAGGASYSNGTWTVSGAGSDLWYSSEPDYHFAYLPVTGDASIIAQITSFSASEDQAKAGLVFTEDLSSDSAMAAVLFTNPDYDEDMYAFTRGDEAHSHPGNAYRTYNSFPDPKYPYWFKIERIGDRITLFSSPDGASWSTAHCADSDLADTVYFGLAVCSKNNGELATAVFTDVRITGGDGGEAADVPAAPYAVYVSPAETETTLRWLESFEADHYNVLRAADSSGPYETIAQVDGTFYVDTDVSRDYFYAVSAENEIGISSRSKIDYARSRNGIIEAEDCDASSGLRWESCSDFWGGTNTSFGSAGDWCLFEEVTVGTDAVFTARVSTGNSAVAGQIEVRAGSSSGTLLGTVDVPYTGGWQDWETVTTQLNADPGTYTICLVFRDANSTGSSAVFNLNWFSIIDAAGATNLRAVPVDGSQVDLGWDKMEGATAYRLKRSTVSGGPYTEVVSTNDTAYSDTGLTAGTTYYYVISAVYDTVESADSDEVSAVPSAPIRFENLAPESAGMDGGGFSAVFSASEPGYSYSVLAAESLVHPDWQDASGEVSGTGGELTIDVPLGTETNRYYKLQVTRP